MLELVKKAAEETYHLKRYDEEEDLQALLFLQLLKKLSQCFAILERLTWHKSNKLSNILEIIYVIV
jgi:hypothetical protein